MITIKNFLSLLLLVAIAAVFNAPNAAAQTQASGEPALVFSADDISQWQEERIPNSLPNGRTVVATHKTNKTKFVVVAREGKIVQAGTINPAGNFVALTPSSSPCNPIICATFQPKKCFIMPWGGCVCVCGPWITSNSGGGN